MNTHTSRHDLIANGFPELDHLAVGTYGLRRFRHAPNPIASQIKCPRVHASHGVNAARPMMGLGNLFASFANSPLRDEH